MKATNIDTRSKPPVQDWADITTQLDKGDFHVPRQRRTAPLHDLAHHAERADGSPHVTAVGAVWDGEALWFQTADRTHKAKNLVRDPRCAVSVSLEGCDVVVEGTAETAIDPDDVARVAEVWATRGGWPVKPDEHGTGITAPFNAPGLGDPPWFIYRVTPSAATSVKTEGEEGGATRWTF